ncbi:MAG: aminopeptidase P family protein [Deltaproteobacteria bacterium]|nr:aminopeptidase P family protein [Deltaproteobacteria bacterium]
MEKTIYSRRIDTFRKNLDLLSLRDNFAAWIIQPENRQYLSGFRAADSQFTESSGALIIDRSHSLLVTDPRYGLEAEKEAVDFEVRILKGDFADSFSGLISGIGTGVLGFEEDYLTWGLHRRLADKFGTLSPPVTLEPLRRTAEMMREVKDESEISAMKTSADLMSAVLDEVIAGLRPGITEREVARRIEGLAREHGADSLAFPAIVASGPNSALPHAVPSERKLKAGEPIIIDVGARLDGYCSDMTRTIFLGEPESEFREIYSIVRLAQIEALKAVRPGVESSYPDRIARQIIGDAGFGDFFNHSLGHGVGLATHEGPRLGPLNPVILKKGMVVTVEPGIYIPEKGGVRLEEMVTVEDDGPKILTINNHIYNFS